MEEWIHYVTCQSVPQNPYLGKIPAGDQKDIGSSPLWLSCHGRLNTKLAKSYTKNSRETENLKNTVETEIVSRENENTPSVLVVEDCIPCTPQNSPSNCGNSYYCNTHFETFYKYVMQSSDVVKDANTEEMTTEQVQMQFTEGESGQFTEPSTVNQLYMPTCTTHAEIEKFMSRPAIIDTRTWSVASSIDVSFAPWELFFEKPAIKAKLDNYPFLRCDLHIKVQINASPFYYGALLVSYEPLNDFFGSSKVNTTASDPLVPYSQRPHIWIYPQNSEGGEMILPFIYPYEWLQVDKTTNLRYMGRIHFDSVDPLRNANSVVGADVSIITTAWAENITLNGMTVEASLQSSNRKKDEYSSNGAISKPASAIARAAGMLSTLPAIGPFATATSIAANGVADIAKLFGYSKVPVASDVEPMKNLPFHGLAVSDISDATERLTVDSKNELTINNKCIGDRDEDPLNISKFVQRQSYLTSFIWASTKSVNDLLWNTYVSPYMSSVTPGTSEHAINGTPMWVVSQMFEHWRGDIIFDFKIICSQYHRGRLRFSWDPIGNVATTGTPGDTTHTTYNHILDISDTTELSLRVPYNQRAAYLKTPSSLTATIFSTSALSKDSSDTVNGIMTVRVLTEQTSPVSSADIQILVSVRGAENLEFANPKEIDDTLNFFTVQSSDRDRVFQTEEKVFGEKSSLDENLNLVYMGEKVTSLRELLMRCNLHKALSLIEEITLTRVMRVIQARRPIFPGFDPNGIHNALGLISGVSEPYNFVAITPYHLISQCFLGERGSFTWKVNIDGFHPHTIVASRSKTPLVAANYNPQPQVLSTSNSGASKDMILAIKTMQGSMMLNTRTNEGVSFNAPMYANTTILDTSPESRVLGLSNVSGSDAVIMSIVNKEEKNGGHDQYFPTVWFNVGPDYSPFFFMNVPTMYLYASYPTSV